MLHDAENPRAVAGHNEPPEPLEAAEPTAFEIAKKAVEDAFEETVLWLDGKPIDSQELADGVGNLLAVIRKAEALADETRKAEKADLDKQVVVIQQKYAPLIGNTTKIKGKSVLAAESCKAALQPWLDAEDKRLREEARKAREEADRKTEEARAALRATEAADLAARAAAEALLTQAKKAETAANVASRQTATAGGAMGRAAGLRSTWVPTLVDPVAAARHYWTAAHQEMTDFLVGLAERDVRLGLRSIPGFQIDEIKRAV